MKEDVQHLLRRSNMFKLVREMYRRTGTGCLLGSTKGLMKAGGGATLWSNVRTGRFELWCGQETLEGAEGET